MLYPVLCNNVQAQLVGLHMRAVYVTSRFSSGFKLCLSVLAECVYKYLVIIFLVSIFNVVSPWTLLLYICPFGNCKNCNFLLVVIFVRYSPSRHSRYKGVFKLQWCPVAWHYTWRIFFPVFISVCFTSHLYTNSENW